MFVVMPKHMLNKIMNLKFAVNFRVAAKFQPRKSKQVEKFI